MINCALNLRDTPSSVAATFLWAVDPPTPQSPSTIKLRESDVVKSLAVPVTLGVHDIRSRQKTVRNKKECFFISIATCVYLTP
jgi:hypothetical protein